MAMRLVEEHGVGLMGVASATAGATTLAAVQWLGDGGALAAGVTVIGAMATVMFGWIRQMRSSWTAQIQAQGAELAQARARISELERRLDERDEAIDLRDKAIAELRSQVAQLVATIQPHER